MDKLAYLPILLTFLASIIISILLILVSRYLGPHQPNKIKLMAYESGMNPIGTANRRYTVGFYLVAIEFVIFDIEAVFIYPWAVYFKQLPLSSFIGMLCFIMILLVGLIYTIQRGTLNWQHIPPNSKY